jgi:hypothetical protein
MPSKRTLSYIRRLLLEKTVLSEKIINDDLSRVEECATNSTYILGDDFERCDNKGKKSAPKFIPSSTYHKAEKIIKSTKTHYTSNLKPSFNLKRCVKKETPNRERGSFYCMHVLEALTKTSQTSSN